MVSRLFVAAVLALGYCALAAPADGPVFDCASTPSPERVAAVEAHFAKHKETGPSTEGLGGVIQVFFNVISQDNSAYPPTTFAIFFFEHSILL